jgi:ribosomal protein S18 acetylase RimI-like enzyme
LNDLKIIALDSTNAEEHGCYCLKDKRLPGYENKLAWMKERLDEGLKVKILYSKEDGYIGFIEYASGEFSWRGFSDPDYMFIHCIYIAKKVHRNRHLGKLLIDECKKDAMEEGKAGIAVISSGKAMLAENNIFLKNGFVVADTHPPKYELLVSRFSEGTLPQLEKSDISDISDIYGDGLHLLYADQCPYFQKSVDVIEKISKRYNLDLNIVKITSAKEAQQAPSLYGVFNLIYNGELIAEHYISEKRFINILEKKLVK